MRVLRLIMLTLVALLGLSFASLNSELIWVHYYWGAQKLPLSVLLVGSFILGLLLGLSLSLFKFIKLRIENHWLKSKIAAMREKLTPPLTLTSETPPEETSCK